MKTSNFIVAMLILAWGYSSQAQILIEDGETTVTSSSSINRSQLRDDIRSGMKMRGQRRVGIGMTAMGPLAVAGVNLELNLTSRTSFMGGFGFGQDFQAFAFQMRRFLAGETVLPYIAGGFARWYTPGNGSSDFSSSNPGFLAKKFLSSSEKRSGKFSENLIFPSLGIQFLKLNGKWAGASVYGEVVFLMDIDDFVAATTGTLGFSYYF